jgi:D-alanyl-D-alanine carboxypeptidase (penicillin-binding protein 5/6)
VSKASNTRCAKRRAKLVVALAFVFIPQCAMGTAWAQEESTAGAARAGVATDEVSEQVPQPEVAARAWALTDLQGGEYLAGKNASTRLAMGSTDKMMVALVALDLVDSGEANLDEEVTVSEEAAAFAVPAYSNVGLFPGDVVSIRELIQAALIASGNDASYALAEHLGGGGAAGVERFVEEMNRKVEDLGLPDTHFQNPTGLDARGQYSSARDLASIARAALQKPLFKETVGTPYTTITTQDRLIEVVSTNELLSLYAPATGVKTGYTPGAGPCLVASAAAGNESYVSVVLGDEYRFPDSIQLMKHGFETYDRKNLVVEGERYARADVPYRRGEKVDLVARESVDGLMDASSRVEREVRLMEEPPGSARPGTKLGEVVVKVDGERVGESALVARKGYDEASLGERVWYTVGGLFQ